VTPSLATPTACPGYNEPDGTHRTAAQRRFRKNPCRAALLPLSFFGIVYLIAGLSAPPGWTPALLGLAACYFTAFLALASEWFWARWFASGLGWSGILVGLASLAMAGWHPALAIYTGLHVTLVVMLLGPKMAARYDLQPGWREHFGMDEFGVARVRKTVTRAAAALPSLIIWALGPKQPVGHAIMALAVLALGAGGLFGLLRLRTWGLLALGAGALVALPSLAYVPAGTSALASGLDSDLVFLWIVLGPVLLVGAWLPFAGPLRRYYTSLGTALPGPGPIRIL
jgi:hypothetical protein